MKGTIDEFVLFETAYDESEIRRLFEIGSPYETQNSYGSFSLNSFECHVLHIVPIFVPNVGDELAP